MVHRAVQQLERQIARKGEDVVYSSYDFDGNETTTNLRAIVRGYRPEQLTGTITEDDMSVVLSPRPLAAAGLDPVKDDFLTVGGRQRFIYGVGVIRIGSEPVRVELRVRG